MGIKCTAVMIMVTLLSSCGGPSSNFCKAENRRIPDAELKGRMLLNLRQHVIRNGKGGARLYGGLPPYIEHYLSMQVPFNAPDTDVRAALTAFVNNNPLCCQFTEITKNDYDMLSNFEELTSYDKKGGELFSWLVVLKSPPYVKLDKNNIKIYRNIWSSNPAFNCGQAVVMNYG